MNNEVQVGDVRKEAGTNYVYIITYIGEDIFDGSKLYNLLYTDGEVASDVVCERAVKEDKLLAHYDSWITAVNSKEFRNAYETEKWKEYDA